MLRAQQLQNPPRLDRFYALYRIPEVLAVLAAFVALAAETGYGGFNIGIQPGLFSAIEIVLLAVLAVKIPCIYAFSSTLRTGYFRCAGETVWLGLCTAVFAYAAVTQRIDEMQIVRIALFGFAMVRLVFWLRAVQRWSISPSMLLTLCYAALILVGACLLMLPRATATGIAITFVDALFMSASACCVTGLSLYDVGAQFTEFGQVVLLVLVQIGGLGIMTFAAFVTIAFGAGMSIRDRVAMGEVLNYDVVGKIGKLIFTILVLTLVIEAAGAIALYGHWFDTAGVPLETGRQIYYSVFHSITAFCNAGFSLHGDSLVRYHGEWPVVLSISLLIILGGIGFTVMLDLLQYRPWRHAFARRLPVVGKRLRRHALPRLSLQTKVVLLSTAVLIVGGAAIFWLLERNTTLAGMPPHEQVMNALFHGGVTPRTAGFNTVDCGQMTGAGQYVTILLMFIGASPGSTGGGLKTTAVFILLLALFNTFRGRPVEVFKRRIGDEQVRHVLVVLVISLIVVNGAVLLLTTTEHAIMAKAHGFEALTFEVVSAFATVGLSTGITTDLSDVGRLVLTLCMLLGRIGPLALVMAIGRRQRAAFDYPSESVMLG